MNIKERYIRQLVYSASGRFSACETQADFAAQQQLYEALLVERIDELLAAERERCARVAVHKDITGRSTDYQAGWFDGIEDMAAAIRALEGGE